VDFLVVKILEFKFYVEILHVFATTHLKRGKIITYSTSINLNKGERGIQMKVPNTENNAKSCLCDKGDCPTYNQGNLSKTLFCSIGKSEKVPQRIHCPCDVCPVWVEYDLSDYYYCIEGAPE